ncbi:methyl-accepting chemotaxis protein [Lysinibacillus sp. KU-BSD001]|uniref:methyl-accepting chemotaxis protein n=1 Tax=Lysinibacillus sp. KU-BSD001 TaxID=3141328 RepID=UPI0036E7BE40
MKFKSIGVKLTASIIMLLATTCIALGISSYLNSSSALQEQVETNLGGKAQDVSHYIEEVFKRLFIEVESIADQNVLKEMNLEQQFAYLNSQLTERADYLAFGIIDENGTSYYSDGTTADLSDREYVINAFKGETAMSDILISRVTNEPVIIIATPIDTVTGEKALLLARIDGYVLSDVVDEIQVGETGYAFIVNDEGTIQGHTNREYVKNQMNFMTQAEETGEWVGEATAIQEMISNDKGFFEFENTEGHQRLVGYHTLDNGWTMAVTADRHEMLEGLSDLTRSLIISTIAFLIIAIGFAVFVSRSISKPIKELVNISEHLALGDFQHEVPKRYRKRGDELGILAGSLSKMVGSMKEMISKVNDNASNVGNGSNELMSEVNKVTEMTSAISNAIVEVERGSVAQSTMADEGAYAMEQMALGVQQVAEVASTVAEHTQQIENQIHSGHQAVSASIQQMSAIQQGTTLELEVIRKLENESKEIGLISEMITDISDQTNLLALNASIEAARAGDAGKGFAVVAEEVRKLSEQTAQSAAQINALIGKVQVYTTEAVKAAESGEENVQRGLVTIHSVESRFEEIVHSVEKITREIEQLSSSAQQMSANTEEVTASIEEMAATANASTEYIQEVTKSTGLQRDAVEAMGKQAEQLNNMAVELRVAVSQFKL